MVYFVIVGKPDCPNFVHACHVAHYLYEKLPNFQYKKIEKLPNEWASFISDLNRINTWYIVESPAIWKEINIWGSKKYLIGGLSEFWEYVYCYYGLESLIPKDEIQKLAIDNMRFYLEEQKSQQLREKNVFVISILGASNLQTPYIIQSIIEMECLRKLEGTDFKLWDCQANTNTQKNQCILDCAKTFNRKKIFGNRNIVTIVDTEEEALADCDLLLLVEDFEKLPSENYDTWLGNCYGRMVTLADYINNIAKRSLIVILNNEGPTGFMATCLVENCTKIKLSNIIAISADLGLSMINLISQKTGVLKSQLSAPPVWGYIGIKTFVDSSHIVFKADMCRPYESAATAPLESTLPLGTIKTELRLISYLIPDNTNFADIINERNEKIKLQLGRYPIRAKHYALCNFLKLWFSNQQHSNNEIISLGVCSNGTFDVPPGVVFSQPVMMNENRKWVPYSKFPLMNDFTRQKIQECISVVQSINRKFSISREVATNESDSN